MTDELERRFWSKVNKTDECWLWTGSTNERGYGQFWNGQRLIRAHRFSWESENGPVPDGLHVCHRCDNPRCVRPSHLFVGTKHDNMKDAASKGRLPVQRYPEHRARFLRSGKRAGELNGRHKLTMQDVLAIRELAKAGMSISALSRKYAVSRPTIDDVVRGKSWRTHVG